MDQPVAFSPEKTAGSLNLPVEGVRRAAELLDDGNTVPFITRYRRDQTGGLREDDIRAIQESMQRQRALAERRETILRSIASQGKLTDELRERIEKANSPKLLEDLYFPFKPKKQTLATIARDRGLEPFASEVLTAAKVALNLEQRAADFVDTDKGLPGVADVLLGVGHLIAEKFSERVDIRQKLRQKLRDQAELVSTAARPQEESTKAAKEPGKSAEAKPQDGAAKAAGAPDKADSTESASPRSEQGSATATGGGGSKESDSESQQAEPERAADSSAAPPATPAEPRQDAPAAGESSNGEPPNAESPTADSPEKQPPTSESASVESPATLEAATAEVTEPPANPPPEAAAAEAPQVGDDTTAGSPASPTAEDKEQKPSSDTSPRGGGSNEAAATVPASKQQTKPAAATEKKPAKKSKKKDKKKGKDDAFKDYFDYRQPAAKIPPHRILAINRGERAKALKVRVEIDVDSMYQAAAATATPADHPHAEFLAGCLRDALTRLLLPSLERELRREMTERAETHAVEVFARNLRHLLLQPPVRGRRVLAVDPGFRSGCKLAALDEFGNVLGHGVIHLVGNQERRKRSRARLVEMIALYEIEIVAIGNGTACRESENLVADILAEELKDRDIVYVVVNEAGASVYSTSDLGREELPDFDPVTRSAISIGRRLLDPLSELVKINPANLGVGMYQHDLKAKHLRASLDTVVESCVNYVGVDVNTASPALLKYVSGLNQLTARRIYDHRCERGPFRSREELKEVPGFGDAAFVQAAGFLKIPDAENPLDATWIHPESYGVADAVLQRLGIDKSLLRGAVSTASGQASGAAPPPVAQEPKQEQAAPAAVGSQAPESSDQLPPGPEATPPAAQEAQEEESDSPPDSPPAATTAAPALGSPKEDEDNVETAAAVEPTESAPSPAPPTAENTEQTTTQEDNPPQVGETAGAHKAEAAAASKGTPSGSTSDKPADQATTSAARKSPPPLPPELKKALQADAESLAKDLNQGMLLVRDILSALGRPARDPREDMPPPIFRRGVMKLEDLSPGMQLRGSVLNVVDFGVFVDIGLHDSGLVHISRLADRYVSDPHEIVSVGDTIDVWVVDVDTKRRRVSLTAVSPEAAARAKERARERAEERKRARGKPQGKAAAGDQPRGKRKFSKRQPQGARSAKKSSYRPKKAPAPAKPITKKMIEGKEPMRAFSDLAQFYDRLNSEGGEEQGDSSQKGGKKKPSQ